MASMYCFYGTASLFFEFARQMVFAITRVFRDIVQRDVSVYIVANVAYDFFDVWGSFVVHDRILSLFALKLTF